MKITCFLLFISILQFSNVLSAQVEVKSFDIPDKGNSNFGETKFVITVTYGKTSPSDVGIDLESINMNNIRIRFTNPDNPNYQDREIYGESFSYIEGAQTLEVVYIMTLESEYLNPDLNGQMTVYLEEYQVYTLSDDFYYLPAQILDAFSVNITIIPAITVKGRLWLETGTPSFNDDGPSVDEGIEEWAISVERDTGEYWSNDFNYWIGTTAVGTYQVAGLIPGTYRIGPQDMLPEIASQALGDPSRNDIKDGFYHITLTLAEDGSEVVVNLPYLEELNPPNVEHDEYTVPHGFTDYPLNVLTNDPSQGLEIIGLSSTPTNIDSDGIDSTGSRGSRIWTDGIQVFYTPVSNGWEIFWYKVRDENGNTDLTRVWTYVDFNLVVTFKAADDLVNLNKDAVDHPINVVGNDIILSPHSGGSTTVSVGSTTSMGGNITRSGQTILYTPPVNYTGNDTFSYTISSNGENSSGTVYLKVVGSSTPPWAGYTLLDGAGNVNTAAWLGWLNVSDAPWIYSYDLDNWLYLPEDHISGFGGWGYVPRR